MERQVVGVCHTLEWLSDTKDYLRDRIGTGKAGLEITPSDFAAFRQIYRECDGWREARKAVCAHTNTRYSSLNSSDKEWAADGLTFWYGLCSDIWKRGAEVVPLDSDGRKSYAMRPEFLNVEMVPDIPLDHIRLMFFLGIGPHYNCFVVEQAKEKNIETVIIGNEHALPVARSLDARYRAFPISAEEFPENMKFASYLDKEYEKHKHLLPEF